MQRTRITYHEVYVAPGRPAVVEHGDSETVTVLSGDHAGGGGDARWLINLVIVGPASDGEALTHDLRAGEARS